MARVALETTLLVHGVPREAAVGLWREIQRVVRGEGAEPALVGVVKGRAVVGMGEAELMALLEAPAGSVLKVNTANLGVVMSRGGDGATTVSATMELAAKAGVKVFATGGIGGVHPGYGSSFDISSDLAALARFPVAVVASGVKSILDVAATREALETLGVPVVGWKTDAFPAFYLRQTEPALGVDARFDDVAELGAFVRMELARTGRGVVVANPIPEEHAVPVEQWEMWLRQARAAVEAAGFRGRAVTPALLAALHEASGGATLRANIELVKANAGLAGRIARGIGNV